MVDTSNDGVVITFDGVKWEPDFHREIEPEVLKEAIKTIDLLNSIEYKEIDIDYVPVFWIGCVYGFVCKSEISGKFAYFPSKMVEEEDKKMRKVLDTTS